MENTLNQALESVQSLVVSAEKNVRKLSDEEITAIPAEFARDIAKRIRDAAQMGDVMMPKYHRSGNQDALRFLCAAQQTDCSIG